MIHGDHWYILMTLLNNPTKLKFTFDYPYSTYRKERFNLGETVLIEKYYISLIYSLF